MAFIRRHLAGRRSRRFFIMVTVSFVVTVFLVVMVTTLGLPLNMRIHVLGKRTIHMESDWRENQSTRGKPPPTSALSDVAIPPCDWTADTLVGPMRTRTRLNCSYTSSNPPSSQIPSASSIIKELVPAAAVPSVTSLSDKACLRRVIEDHCSGKQPCSRVPKVVHYVQFGSTNMSLEHFLSVLSATKFIRPCLVLIHGDSVPTGPYWRAALSLVHNLVHVQLERPRTIYGNKIWRPEHSSDVARLRILQDFGGIYLDTDQMVLQPVDDFLDFPVVISKETPTHCGNAFVIAKPGAAFLHLWLQNYTDFNGHHWEEHSTRRSFMLAQDFPNLVRVIDGFYRPNFFEVRSFFSRRSVPTFDWSSRRGFHFYHNSIKDFMRARRVDRQDNVVGDLVRTILYGDKNRCLSPAG